MPETFGQRLRRARIEKGWSMETLAEKSGIHFNALVGYEHGEHEPGIFRATCLADALGVSLDWLGGRSEDNSMKAPVRNAPLTPEELGGMSGKFVYLVPSENTFITISKPGLVGIYGPIFGPADEKWFLLYNQNGKSELAKAKDYLRTWTAYRCKPGKGKV